MSFTACTSNILPQDPEPAPKVVVKLFGVGAPIDKYSESKPQFPTAEPPSILAVVIVADPEPSKEIVGLEQIAESATLSDTVTVVVHVFVNPFGSVAVKVTV